MSDVLITQFFCIATVVTAYNIHCDWTTRGSVVPSSYATMQGEFVQIVMGLTAARGYSV